MQTLVLTAIGDDRSGLVRALADTITAHGGNWERSELAELAGMFAGIVQVTVPDESADSLVRALRPLEGMLDVVVRQAGAPTPAARRRVQIDLLGNDRPGIVRDVSSALADAGLSVAKITTETREAPMAGGLLFDAHIVATLPPDGDPAAVKARLELLANEIMVDVNVSELNDERLA